MALLQYVIHVLFDALNAHCLNSYKTYSLFSTLLLFNTTEEFDDILKDTPRDTRVPRRPGQKSMNDMALNRQYAVIIGEPWSDLQAERKEQAFMAAEEQAMCAIVASEAKRHTKDMAELEKNQRALLKAQAKTEQERLRREEKEKKDAAKKQKANTAAKPVRAQPVKTCCMPTCLMTEARGATLVKCGAKGCKLIFCTECELARKQHIAKFHP